MRKCNEQNATQNRRLENTLILGPMNSSAIAGNSFDPFRGGVLARMTLVEGM